RIDRVGAEVVELRGAADTFPGAEAPDLDVPGIPLVARNDRVAAVGPEGGGVDLPVGVKRQFRTAVAGAPRARRAVLAHGQDGPPVGAVDGVLDGTAVVEPDADA